MSFKNEWLYNARTPYWEIASSHERYAALRTIKNSSKVHRGKYTLDAVSARLESISPGVFSPKYIRDFELGFLAGKPEAQELLALLIGDLGLDRNEFSTRIKLRPGMAVISRELDEGAPEPKQEPKQAPKQEPKQAPKQEPKQAPKPAATAPKQEPKAAPKPAATAAKVAAKPAPKPEPKMAPSGLVIVNHTLEGYVVVLKGNEIHLMEDTAESLKMKGGCWVAPADDIGRGFKLSPRGTPIK